jgi:O-antigen ligase
MKHLERFFGWLLIAPAILPLVVWGGVVYPYLVPKTLLFYTLSFVTLGVFAVLVAYRTPFFWTRLSRPHAWIPAALLALAYLASVHGVDFYHSFWSIFARGDGLLMLTFAVGDFYLITLFATDAWVRKFEYVVAGVASIVAVYGIGEWLVSGGRIGGLLGNAAFFAGYLGIAFFVTLLAAQSLQGEWRRAAYVSSALQIIAILLTATRGTILALIVAGLALLALVAVVGKGARRVWSALALCALVLSAGLFFLFRAELARVPFAPVARMASIATSDPDVASRLFIWKHMTQEVVARPFLGVGTEHIDMLFNQFYDPTQIQEEWFDRSHNAFLDYAVQYGVGGLALYLALIAALCFAALRAARRGVAKRAVLIALLAITYAVQNFFVFDTISSFWLFLSFVAVTGSVSGAPQKAEALPIEKWARPLSWGVLFIAVFCIEPVAVRPAIAAYDVAHAYAYQLVDAAESARYLEDGYALNTYGNLEYGYEAYAMYSSQQASLSGADLLTAYTAAERILAENFARYPYDARTALYLAHVLSLAPKDATPDPTLFSSALARVIQESPKRSEAWYLLTNLTISEANANPIGSAARISGYDAAKDILARYLALVPTLSEPHFVLAQLELAIGDAASAKAEAALGAQYYKSDLETARRAIAYYESAKDWEDAKTYLEDALALSPGDTALSLDLAKVTYLTGDPQGAARLVEALLAQNPAILESDSAFKASITPYLHEN